MRLLFLLFIFSILISFNIAYAGGRYDGLNLGDTIGKTVASDIGATINGIVIPSLNIQGRVVVSVNDLKNYGLGVLWDNKTKAVEISRDYGKAITPIPIVITNEQSILYSKIKAYIGNKQLLTYDIEGKVYICLEDLSEFGALVWDNNNRRVSLELENKKMQEQPLNDKAKVADANKFFKINGLLDMAKTKVIVVPQDVPIKVRNDYFLILDKKEDPTSDVSNRIEYLTNQMKNRENTEYKIVYTDIWTYINGGEIYHGTHEIDIYSRWNKYIYESIDYSGESIFVGRVIKSYGSYNNPNYDSEIKNLTSQKFIDYRSMISATIEQKIASEYAENNYIPLKIKRKYVTYNSIGVPEANISFKNLSDKTIDAIKVRIYPYDTYDNRVYNFVGEGIFKGIAQRISVSPNCEYGSMWTLNLFENTTKFDVEIYSVHFADGTVWE